MPGYRPDMGSRRKRYRATAAGLALAGVLAAGCTSPSTHGTPSSRAGGSAGTASGASAPPQGTLGTAQVLATGLEVPWGLAFLPDGDALVSERISHRLVRISASGTVTDVATVPGVADDAGEGGLLGVALSPTWTRDHLVYAYLTTATDNRVVRFTWSGGTGIGRVQPIFTGIPKAPNHDGGRLAFGPGGLLYVTAGDALQPTRAPDPSYLGGKVLRMTATGAPAPGNPYPGSVVFTKGHRNPQGLAWGPDGTLYESEFGQSAEDEVNALVAGADYGWPVDEGTLGPHRPGLTEPLLTWPTDDASPSGLAYAGGSLWLATLQGQRLYRIPVLSGGRLGSPTSVLTREFGRLRTVARAPDGALWVTTSNRDGRGDPVAADDRVIRIPLTG